MKFLIAGYFGCGNLGDDAILESLVTGIKDNFPDSKLSVLSGNPSETKKCYKIDSYPRNKFRIVRQQIKKCDVFVLGGGGILQDITSSKSLYYYLSLIRTAKK